MGKINQGQPKRNEINLPRKTLHKEIFHLTLGHTDGNTFYSASTCSHLRTMVLYPDNRIVSLNMNLVKTALSFSSICHFLMNCFVRYPNFLFVIESNTKVWYSVRICESRSSQLLY